MRPSQSAVMKRNVGIDRIADHGRGDPVTIDDRLPERHRGTAQRVDADLHARSADRLHVHDIGQVRHVGSDVVVTMVIRGHAGLLIGETAHARWQSFEQGVGGVLDRAGDVGPGRAAIRRVVLEAAILGRVMRRGNNDPVGKAVRPTSIVGEDRVRDDRSRRGAVVGIEKTSTPLAVNTSSAVASAGVTARAYQCRRTAVRRCRSRAGTGRSPG